MIEDYFRNLNFEFIYFNYEHKLLENLYWISICGICGHKLLGYGRIFTFLIAELASYCLLGYLYWLLCCSFHWNNNDSE